MFTDLSWVCVAGSTRATWNPLEREIIQILTGSILITVEEIVFRS
jgi:uncharacterized cupin superfamily protein